MGPDSEKKRSALCLEVRKTATLDAAWRHVRGSGFASANEDIQKETRRFDENAMANLRQMQAALRVGKFSFTPQKGVTKKRPGKDPRPIVVSPIPNRVVQRAILTTSEMVPGIRDVLNVPTSFGGITGLSDAIAQVIERVKAGGNWYIRSDIPGFFTKIPKPAIIEFIKASSGDYEFAALFEKAMTVELENGDALRREDLYRYFPTGPIGVAQGSALSPLVGNILLRDFDTGMNGAGISCIRYIDDFIIIGPNKTKTEAAFQSARRRLKQFGLDAYDPNTHHEKAEQGAIGDGFDFLGCRIKGHSIQPGKKAQRALLAKVSKAYEEGLRAVRVAVGGESPGAVTQRLAQSHTRVDRIVKGWGESFGFCNDRRPFYDLDAAISAKAREFEGEVVRIAGHDDELRWRRAVGITVLADIGTKELPSADAPRKRKVGRAGKSSGGRPSFVGGRAKTKPARK
jgi:hypothetical protein